MAQSMTCTLLTSLLDNAPATPGLSAIPVGFPANKDGKSAWVGSRISDRDFVCHLTERERVEIYRAVVAFKGRRKEIVTLLHSPACIPLSPSTVACLPQPLGGNWC